jgi:D-3-phosphoglycerate dehydrogenase
MPDALVVTSESHPIEVEMFAEELGESYTISQLELPPGTLHVHADDELITALEGKDAVFLRTGEMTETVIDAVHDLRVIAVHGSGYDHIDVAAATRNGVVVTHNPEGPGPAVVEHTVAMLTVLLREFPERFERTAQGEWSRDPVPELSQQTVGVVGLGFVGSRVARTVSEAYGADVVGYDPYVSGTLDSDIWPRVSRDEMEAAGVELVGKDELFERSDLMTLHTPLTDRTENMVGEDELDTLVGGYLVNTGRGGCVDEGALVDALDSGQLERAALDVLSEEPPDSDHPLVGHPRVYLTPHVASATDGYPPRAAKAAAEKIDTVLSGGRPDTVANPDV